MAKIKFVRENIEVECEDGENLRKVAMREGVELYPGVHKYLNCHGMAQCGECRVYVKKGMESTSQPRFLELARTRFSYFRIGHEDEVRLACQMTVEGDVEIYTQPEFNWFGTGKK